MVFLPFSRFMLKFVFLKHFVTFYDLWFAKVSEMTNSKVQMNLRWLPLLCYNIPGLKASCMTCAQVLNVLRWFRSESMAMAGLVCSNPVHFELKPVHRTSTCCHASLSHVTTSSDYICSWLASTSAFSHLSWHHTWTLSVCKEIQSQTLLYTRAFSNILCFVKLHTLKTWNNILEY